MSNGLKPIEWTGHSLSLLDQTALPEKMSFIDCDCYKEIASAIERLAVRGAPAIGVAAAYGVYLAYLNCQKEEDFEKSFDQACETIRNARPTAVNLSWAVDEMLKVYHSVPAEEAKEALLRRAKEIEAEDKATCQAIGDNGADLFQGKKELHILTHCNAGALATAGIGTALGVIRMLHARGQISCVYADETRPLCQGSRLTATELVEDEIPCCLICDDMAASVMRDKHIDAIIVGADRIAANGDTANKIGTYGLAVMAAYHHIPFYIAAPFSTFDFSIATGKEIVIEERDPDEVRKINGVYSAPKNVPVFNPAFDVTPSELITGIITERGVLTAPYTVSVAQYERSISK